MARTGRPRTLRRLETVLLALAFAVVAANGEPLSAGFAERLLAQAAAADRAGHTAEAAGHYEAILRRNTAFEPIVAARLVQIYTRQAQPAAALAWAARAARHRPDPQAYLAGVHAALGQTREAELLLRNALRNARDPARRATLLWQLAETQTRLGDRDGARATLRRARELPLQPPLQATADRLLDALQRLPDDDGPEPAANAGKGGPPP